MRSYSRAIRTAVVVCCASLFGASCLAPANMSTAIEPTPMATHDDAQPGLINTNTVTRTLTVADALGFTTARPAPARPLAADCREPEQQ